MKRLIINFDICPSVKKTRSMFPLSINMDVSYFKHMCLETSLVTLASADKKQSIIPKLTISIPRFILKLALIWLTIFWALLDAFII